MLPWFTVAGIGYAGLSVLYTAVRVVEDVSKTVYNGPFVSWTADEAGKAYNNSEAYSQQVLALPYNSWEWATCFALTGSTTLTTFHKKYGCQPARIHEMVPLVEGLCKKYVPPSEYHGDDEDRRRLRWYDYIFVALHAEQSVLSAYLSLRPTDDSLQYCNFMAADFVDIKNTGTVTGHDPSGKD